ncbi:MAG: ABC transporter ATP-binding protein [Nitrososphaerales archaeon]|nr:ABC transporter ATP-binding protein [Nitrososphaerales archaeon]
MAELLRLSGVAKRFSGLEVLKDVSFDVSEGQVVGLIGPNGAGKTTLFNIISGALKPNGGKVFFLGKNITGSPPHRVSRLGIARTFQIPQPFPEMSVLQNVEAAGLFGNRDSRTSLPADAESICEKAGLSGKLGTAAKSLTAPEKKRLEVARALSTAPKLLLLDEFAAGFTAAEAAWASGLIKTLSKEFGITIIWTEHVMRILMRSVERVMVLQQGELIAQGSPAEIANNEKVLSAYFGGKAA